MKDSIPSQDNLGCHSNLAVIVSKHLHNTVTLVNIKS